MANMMIKPEPLQGQKAAEFWLSRVDKVMRARERHWNGDAQWRRNIDLYRGRHWRLLSSAGELEQPDSERPRRRITVNKVGSIVLSMLPFMVRRRPKFLLHPRQPAHFVSAVLQQELLNWCWQEFGMQPQIKKSVLDATVLGHGIVKVGFNLEVEAAQPEGRAVDIDYRDYIKASHPYIHRVSPFRFLWDPDAPEHDLNSARWCAEIIYKPLRDVIVDKRYSSSVRAGLRSGKIEATKASKLTDVRGGQDYAGWQEGGTGDFDEFEDDMLVLIELWDKRSGKYYVFLHGHDMPLIERKEWPYPYLEGFPYVMLPFIPTIDDLYPIGVPKWIEDQQYELNRIRTMQFEHRRRFNRKYIVDRNAVDPEGLEQLRVGKDGTLILADHTEAVKPIADAPIPQDQMLVDGIISQDMRELTGADELLRGGKLPSRTTASEIEARTQIMGLKIEDRVEDVDRFVERIGRTVLQHLKANYLPTDVIRIAGPTGQHWTSFSREDIQEEVDFEMESTSAPRTSPEQERAHALKILEIAIQMAQVVGPNSGLDMTALFQWVLEKFDTNKDMARFFPALANPMMPLAAGGTPVPMLNPEQLGQAMAPGGPASNAPMMTGDAATGGPQPQSAPLSKVANSIGLNV